MLAQNSDDFFEDDLDAELMGGDDLDLGSGGMAEPMDLNMDLPQSDFANEPSAPLSSDSSSSVVQGEDIQILDIQYDSKTDGGTLVIKSTGAATYRTREVPEQNQVIVEIANARLPEQLKRPFNMKDFRQAMVSVNAYQELGSNTARVVLQFRQPRSVRVSQDGQELRVVAAEASEPLSNIASNDGALSAADDFDDGDMDLDDLAGEVEAENFSASTDYGASNSAPARASTSGAKDHGKILPTSSLDQEPNGNVRFYGRPISIEVRDTPVRDVITLISDQSGANIILSDDVQGSITLKLRQVPWDQALSIIMKTRSLGYVRQGGVLRIAPISQLQAEIEEARRILEAQEATLPLQVKVIPVSFANVAQLVTQIRGTLQATATTGTVGFGGAMNQTAPQSRGRIEADPRSSSLIVTDTEDNVKRIEQLVKALDTPPLQVMIEGKIVEAREDATRAFGVNWGHVGSDISFGNGRLGHRSRISPGLTTGGSTTVDLRLGTLEFLGDLDAKLSLLEREQHARVISSPRVVTMNSQQATIEQSVNIAITSRTESAQNTTITTTFRPVPTRLQVTPQITPSGEVLMNIEFRREFQAGSSETEASIESRDIKTNVMVKNGQTTVIGGIYQADQNESEVGTPILRHVPVLGWLFKSREVKNVRNELLVFLTPRILNADRTLPQGSRVQ
ncbi:MAG: type IV pilus secretin PilQ [Bdellovibrionales bacterium]|jgi:type IV pilus assembly protein PilQ|nr:type IV pilus secretin PilQ [Bdellovibrionales bacterium]